MSKLSDVKEYILAPEPENSYLSQTVTGINQGGVEENFKVVEERPLTIFLNSQEIVTAMTIGDHPKYLAIGFLFNQKMLKKTDKITKIDFDKELNIVVVRTNYVTNFEEKLQKKTKTSGCALGTIFGDMMEGLDEIKLEGGKVHTSWMYALASKINRTPSIYLEVGAIHGTVLCQNEQPLVYMEDVGRHNAVDKISGWMILENVTPEDKMIYTTGRLTSEMVIKTAHMGIPILISRSGFTAWGVELAKKVGLTLIGRMKGKRFICLSGSERLVFDTDLSSNLNS
jgi:FdhD protein